MSCCHDLNWTNAHDTHTSHITGATHHYVGPRVWVGTVRDPSFQTCALPQYFRYSVYEEWPEWSFRIADQL